MTPNKTNLSLPARRDLTGYLTGAAGFTAVLAASQADAAVTAVTFGFGPTLEASDGGSFVVIEPFGGLSTSAGVNVISINGYGDYGLYNSGSKKSKYGLPTFFVAGTVIGAGGNGDIGYTYFKSPESVIDLTSDVAGFIGFRTHAGYNGYAEVSWDEANSVLTILKSTRKSGHGIVRL